MNNRCKKCGRDIGSLMFSLCGWCAGVGRLSDEAIKGELMKYHEVRK